MRVFLALCFVLLAIAPAEAAGVLRRGNYNEPATLDPHKFNTVYELALSIDLFEGLTAMAPNGDPTPAVAQSWTVSADAKTWTFKLRPGLKWSDGAPITADDVVFSFRRILDPKTAGQLAGSFYAIKNARKVNGGELPLEQVGVSSPAPDTIVIELEHPAPYLPALLSSGTGAIVPRHVVEKFGDDWIKAENFVSNGAYLLKNWIPNGGITLVRNPNYREPGALDTVIYEPTDDIDAAVTRFRGGGLDMQFEFPSARTAELQREMPKETKITPATLTFYLTLNLRNPKFKDVRIRKALSLAIDRDLLVSKVLRGGETPLMTWVPPAIPGYTAPDIDEQSLSMPERLARAKALLAAAGITPEHPLRLVYSHGANSDRKRIAVAISAMWKPLGVIASLQGMEGKVLFGNLHEGDYELGYLGGSADYPDAASFLTGLLSTEPAGNYPQYNSPAYDALVARAEEMTDPKERAAVLGQAEALMIKDQPIIPLFAGVTRELIATHVHGWEPSPTAMHLSRYLSVDRPPGAPQ